MGSLGEDPEYFVKLDRFWAQIDPTGTRRAEVAGATGLTVSVDNEITLSFNEH